MFNVPYKCDRITTAMVLLIGREYSLEGSEVCSKCPPGTFGDETGRIGAEGLPCLPLSALVCATLYTFLLSLLTNSDAGGTDECGLCVAGKHSAYEGMMACEDCNNGYFGKEAGYSTCGACDAGKYSQGDSSAGPTGCLDCLAGKHTHGNSGTPQCSDCIAGKQSSHLSPGATCMLRIQARACPCSMITL